MSTVFDGNTTEIYDGTRQLAHEIAELNVIHAKYFGPSQPFYWTKVHGDPKVSAPSGWYQCRWNKPYLRLPGGSAMKNTLSAKEYFDAHPHYDNFCPWGGTPWYSEFNDAVMKFAEAYSASSHSELRLGELRRMLDQYPGQQGGLQAIAEELYRMARSPESFKCAARSANTGANDPQECDWPFCGCDPYADKVIAEIQEAGFTLVKDEDLLKMSSIHSEPELVKLREALRELLDVVKAWHPQSGDDCIFDQAINLAEAALASTPQNEQGKEI